MLLYKRAFLVLFTLHEPLKFTWVTHRKCLLCSNGGVTFCLFVCATMMPYFDNASLTAFAKRGEAIYMRVTDLRCIQASELLLKKRRKKSLMSFVPLSYKLLSRGSDFVSLSSC